MFCKQCGKPIDDGQDLCEDCKNNANVNSNANYNANANMNNGTNPTVNVNVNAGYNNANTNAPQKSKIAELSFADISQILWRRYQAIDCAIEIFTEPGPAIFLVFQSHKERTSFIESISRLQLSNIKVLQKKIGILLEKSK